MSTIYDRNDYNSAKAYAQKMADLTGFDYGIEKNALFKDWHVFLLPRRENRFGHELLCEVVWPTKNAKSGHGPP